MKYTNCAGCYCIVTPKNIEILSKWRFHDDKYLIDIGKYVGIGKDDNKKGHNSTTGHYSNDGKYFDKLVSVEELFRMTNFEYEFKEKNYEIY